MLCIGAMAARAQDPVQWTASVQKAATGSYELHLKAVIAAGWHVYSQSTPPGGPLPTVITMHQNPLIVLNGSMDEKGEKITRREESFGVDVQYFNRQLEIVQRFTKKAKVRTNISGSVKYMVCNDHECLPPKDWNFQVSVD